MEGGQDRRQVRGQYRIRSYHSLLFFYMVSFLFSFFGFTVLDIIFYLVKTVTISVLFFLTFLQKMKK
jgi:hypothetical protein